MRGLLQPPCGATDRVQLESEKALSGRGGYSPRDCMQENGAVGDHCLF
ncbi:hypothetical protein [uncultured Selenomonas sp.]|nr:hypothetical protein [uncultured Selenomonas sp.]